MAPEWRKASLSQCTAVPCNRPQRTVGDRYTAEHTLEPDLLPGKRVEGFWHKNAIVYTIDVESFADGNGDGVGDFLGLAGKLDYLAGLNIDCIWLQPFFTSP